MYVDSYKILEFQHIWDNNEKSDNFPQYIFIRIIF